MASNLPPGVTEGMIPGNRPEDLEWENFFEWLMDEVDSRDITPDHARLIWKAGIAVHNLSVKNHD